MAGAAGVRSMLQPRERRGSPPSAIDARLILNIRWFALTGQLLALLFTFIAAASSFAPGSPIWLQPTL